MTAEWTHITAGLPPCDGETVFVGINSAGYCGCFTNYGRFNADSPVHCWYDTAEASIDVMSDLVRWKRLPGE